MSRLKIFDRRGKQLVHLNHPPFDTDWYLERNADVGAGVNPLCILHALEASSCGIQALSLTLELYRTHYSDLGTGASEPFLHYLNVQVCEFERTMPMALNSTEFSETAGHHRCETFYKRLLLAD
jgi:hypothetical protein